MSANQRIVVQFYWTKLLSKNTTRRNSHAVFCEIIHIVLKNVIDSNKRGFVRPETRVSLNLTTFSIFATNLRILL